MMKLIVEGYGNRTLLAYIENSKLNLKIVNQDDLTSIVMPLCLNEAEMLVIYLVTVIAQIKEFEETYDVDED